MTPLYSAIFWGLFCGGALVIGAMLAMIVDTMIPEAFAETHDWAGLIAVAGFLVSFALTRTAG